MIGLTRIVLFDDDHSNHKHYQNLLKDHFNLFTFVNPFHYEEALSLEPGVILIDVNMPLMNGFELNKIIQSHGMYNGCPVIYISASDSDEVVLGALRNGGHDFLGRMMSRSEILSRITNKIEYSRKHRHIYKLGSVKLSLSELKVYFNDEILDLTLTEMKILRFLIREYPRVSMKEDIILEVWPGQKVLSGTLNTHLTNLRNKISRWEYNVHSSKTKGIYLISHSENEVMQEA